LVAVDARSGLSRYRLLETVRDYAWERLEAAIELDRVAEGHARHFGDLAVRLGAGLESADELASCRKAEDDLENFRAAFRWSIDNADADLANCLMDALMPMSWLRGTPFGTMTREAAEMPAATDHPLRAMALAMVCQALTQDGAIEEALDFADAAEAETERLLGSPEHARLRCRVRGCLSTAVALAGQNDRLVSLARRSVQDARSNGYRFEVMRFLIMLASATQEEERDEAIKAGEEALRLAEEFAVPSYLAWAPMMLAGRLTESDPTRAEALLAEAARAATVADNSFAQFMARIQLASIQSARGNYASAATTLLEQIETSLLGGDRSTTLQAIGALIPVLVQLGDVDTALLAGAWAERRGVTPYNEVNPTYLRFHGDTYISLRDRLTEEQKRTLSLRASELDEAGLLAIARPSVESIRRNESSG
ncbi:MAG TPA: hypothetical protein VGR90_05675, partial [Acidimicrobiales bacterium]|nr:hypothetical protein [Acidimicrobiales bacterium]